MGETGRLSFEKTKNRMDFQCLNRSVWKEALSSYSARIVSLNKPQLVSLDDFYCNQLPALIRQRNPNPYITTSELSKLMQWKLTRGKWRFLFLFFYFLFLYTRQQFKRSFVFFTHRIWISGRVYWTSFRPWTKPL